MKNPHAQALAKLSHQKSPRSKEFYRMMQKLSINKKVKKNGLIGKFEGFTTDSLPKK